MDSVEGVMRTDEVTGKPRCDFDGCTEIAVHERHGVYACEEHRFILDYEGGAPVDLWGES